MDYLSVSDHQSEQSFNIRVSCEIQLPRLVTNIHSWQPGMVSVLLCKLLMIIFSTKRHDGPGGESPDSDRTSLLEEEWKILTSVTDFTACLKHTCPGSGRYYRFVWSSMNQGLQTRDTKPLAIIRTIPVIPQLSRVRDRGESHLCHDHHLDSV